MSDKPAYLTSAARLRIVEAAIRERGWSEKIVAELVRETGASRRTLYRDKDKIVKELVSEETSTLEERRVLFLAAVRHLAEESAAEKAYPVAARLLDLECRVLGIDRVPMPEVEAEEPGQVDTSLEAVLAETRRMRRAAQAGHSFVAADRLLAREQQIASEIAKRDEEIAKRNLQHLTKEERVAMVVDLFAKLPADVRRQVLDQLPS